MLTVHRAPDGRFIPRGFLKLPGRGGRPPRVPGGTADHGLPGRPRPPALSSALSVTYFSSSRGFMSAIPDPGCTLR